jgi:hypothetical protein
VFCSLFPFHIVGRYSEAMLPRHRTPLRKLFQVKKFGVPVSE